MKTEEHYIMQPNFTLQCCGRRFYKKEKVKPVLLRCGDLICKECWNKKTGLEVECPVCGMCDGMSPVPWYWKEDDENEVSESVVSFERKNVLRWIDDLIEQEEARRIHLERKREYIETRYRALTTLTSRCPTLGLRFIEDTQEQTTNSKNKQKETITEISVAKMWSLNKSIPSPIKTKYLDDKEVGCSEGVDYFCYLITRHKFLIINPLTQERRVISFENLQANMESHSVLRNTDYFILVAKSKTCQTDEYVLFAINWKTGNISEKYVVTSPISSILQDESNVLYFWLSIGKTITYFCLIATRIKKVQELRIDEEDVCYEYVRERTLGIEYKGELKFVEFGDDRVYIYSLYELHSTNVVNMFEENKQEEWMKQRYFIDKKGIQEIEEVNEEACMLWSYNYIENEQGQWLFIQLSHALAEEKAFVYWFLRYRVIFENNTMIVIPYSSFEPVERNGFGFVYSLFWGTWYIKGDYYTKKTYRLSNNKGCILKSITNGREIVIEWGNKEKDEVGSFLDYNQVEIYNHYFYSIQV